VLAEVDIQHPFCLRQLESHWIAFERPEILIWFRELRPLQQEHFRSILASQHTELLTDEAGHISIPGLDPKDELLLGLAAKLTGYEIMITMMQAEIMRLQINQPSPHDQIWTPGRSN
jgi:hypothetical protein